MTGNRGATVRIRKAAAADFDSVRPLLEVVVAGNGGAVRLWQKLWFEIAVTLPEAFHYPAAGYVDAGVIYKWLSK